ncbi:putative nonstructural protein [Jonchet virus]|uniref:Putative nonstructural protein n=1 Tax=Jonchet virus TaxID=1664809 RepID=A0A0H4B3R1_9VIRU|nr:putative nonstructural protein [Jonchet virus]AKN56873.1 putative nonstructural protein [Jonchet virus]
MRTVAFRFDLSIDDHLDISSSVCPPEFIVKGELVFNSQLEVAHKVSVSEGEVEVRFFLYGARAQSVVSTLPSRQNGPILKDTLRKLILARSNIQRDIVVVSYLISTAYKAKYDAGVKFE